MAQYEDSLVAGEVEEAAGDVSDEDVTYVLILRDRELAAVSVASQHV